MTKAHSKRKPTKAAIRATAREPLLASPELRVVHSLQRGLEVLSFVVDAGSPVKLQEIVRRLGLDKASAFRLLTTLEVEGLVAKQPVDKSYTIGAKLVRWMSSARKDQELVHLCRPHLEKLTRQTHESSHIGVLTGMRLTLIDVVPPADTLVAIKHSVGGAVEIHCSALGKALLAFQPPELQDRIIAALDFPRFTGATIVEPAVFREALQNVRDRRFAVDDAEFNDWIYCMAAPILDKGNHAVASLGISVFKPTLNADAMRLAFLQGAVCDCAAAVSHDLSKVK